MTVLTTTRRRKRPADLLPLGGVVLASRIATEHCHARQVARPRVLRALARLVRGAARDQSGHQVILQIQDHPYRDHAHPSPAGRQPPQAFGVRLKCGCAVSPIVDVR